MLEIDFFSLLLEIFQCDKSSKILHGEILCFKYFLRKNSITGYFLFSKASLFGKKHVYIYAVIHVHANSFRVPSAVIQD